MHTLWINFSGSEPSFAVTLHTAYVSAGTVSLGWSVAVRSAQLRWEEAAHGGGHTCMALVIAEDVI